MEKFDIENFPTSECAKKMLSFVSDGFYDESYVGKWIFEVMGIEYDKALEIVKDLPAQFFPETATWGLMYHEIKWGLPVRLNMSYDERRRLIYQKRDYRAPMTPYRMEKYLENATGFEVHIADAGDMGEYGFVPTHPNVFKAYFLGEGTLNTALVHGILNRIKQSHTEYTVNDRIEIKLDSVQLLQMKLVCVFVMYVPFWDSYIYRGARRYDGATRYNARRSYGLRVKLKTVLELYTEQAVRCAAVYSSYATHEMTAEILMMMLYSSQLREALGAAVCLYTAMKSPSGEPCGMSIETRRNVVRHNGMRRYNGKMKYNALYKKEEVE